ncbi:hypothetical protein NL676_016008 [Syzygium grande]|nr:hypothetical protein NL676_016008 [Syzygium grande]
MDARKEKLPSPWQTAGALALAFAVGSLVLLLATAFIKEYQLRLAVVILAVSLALVGFGWPSKRAGNATGGETQKEDAGWRVVGYGHHLWFDHLN